eukprot:TRINITY_DN2649_c0_g1_i2.p1 TRINITY_DN2649_c0_g1~~TRINITY_DN2649_c0_g1_i2.p1  ORF type:complete len:121 (-),score=38.87 TRINITY_DN2649_c0_g1_i2:18-380(-)
MSALETPKLTKLSIDLDDLILPSSPDNELIKLVENNLSADSFSQKIGSSNDFSFVCPSSPSDILKTNSPFQNHPVLQKINCRSPKRRPSSLKMVSGYIAPFESPFENENDDSLDFEYESD